MVSSETLVRANTHDIEPGEFEYERNEHAVEEARADGHVAIEQQRIFVVLHDLFGAFGARFALGLLRMRYASIGQADY